MQQLSSLALVLGTAGFVAIGQILWKFAAQKGLGGEAPTIPALGRVLLSPWFLAGCVAYAMGVVFWVIQLSRFALSVSFALTTGVVLLIALAADALLFSIPFSGTRVAGAALILLGIIVATWK